MFFLPLDDKNIQDHAFATHLEKWVDKAMGRRNAMGVPIAYVCRNRLLVAAPTDDPETNYTTHDRELFSRMRIIRPGREAQPAAELESNKAENWTIRANMDNVEVYNCGKICFSSMYLLLDSCLQEDAEPPGWPCHPARDGGRHPGP